MQPPNAQVSSNEEPEVELHCICPALARKKASLIRPGLHGILAGYLPRLPLVGCGSRLARHTCTPEK